MDETAMDYSLLKYNSGEIKNDSAGPVGIKDRISIQKSTLFVIIISVSVIIVGSELFVYLMSSRNNNTCNIAIPEGYAIMSNTLARTVAAKQTSGCPRSWLTYGQSCYFFSNQSVKWLDAMARCQFLGGYLAEIDTAAENQFLKTQAKQFDNAVSECFPNTSMEYKGVRNTTFDGRTCQRWDSQKPHSHTRNNISSFPETSLADAANYCRDPDKEGLPWCYTTDPDERWQFCGIHKCPGRNYWVGMVILEGKWKWMNKQTELDKDYTNWGPAEPSKGNCGLLMGTLDFAWDAVKCNFPEMYICEK